MRWSGQQVLDDGVGAAAALPGLRGLLRTVRPPEFAGTVFHEVEARSVLNRVPGSSPVPFRWTVNPYRGCGHACTYCTVGTTPVLLADGRTRPIAALRVGDVVIGTEEVRGVRRYVRTPVLAHWSTVKPAYRVTLADGTRIDTSGEHRFLTERGWRHVTRGWCASGRRPWLRDGSPLLGPGQVPGEGRRRSHGPAYREGYLTGLVRADGELRDGSGTGGAGVDHAFPSEHLELEVLGRAHHFLATGRGAAAGGRVTVALGGRLAVADVGRAAIVEGRVPVDGVPADAVSVDAVPHARGVGHQVAADRADLAWPLHPHEDWCAGFLAGVVDARGTVTDGVLRVPLVDEQIIGRVAGALHRLGFGFTLRRRDPWTVVRGARRPVGRPVRECEVELAGGPETFLRFLQVVDPAGGRRRDLGGAPVTADPARRVASVRALDVELPMYDITTGTGDFVAAGVVHHNCFARNTHTYLDLDAGADFDRQIVVKVNVARVLERELRSPRWNREPVAMGTNTDPYQRAEGRYRLMPDVISVLARSGTPFSLLTKGTVLSRDLPRIAAAAADVPVNLAVSIALLDRPLQARLEPGTPAPQARLELVRRIVDAGLPCGVMVAPVLPMLTDSADALDALLERIAAAGASGASVLALHLRPGTREWFLEWLAREYPALVEPYARLYRRGAYVDSAYRRMLGERVAPLLRRHGLAGGAATLREQVPPVAPAAPGPPDVDQLSLL